MLVAAVLAATFLCASFAAAVAPGSPAPAIDADDTTGRRFSLAAHRGDVVLVFFAAPGGALTEAMPDLDSLHRTYASWELAVACIVRASEPDEVVALARRHAVAFPVIWDARNDIARRYAPPGLPAAVLVDRSGIVRHVHEGRWPPIAPTIRGELRALLGLYGSGGSPMIPLGGPSDGAPSAGRARPVRQHR